ncbi:major facilitator superfamily protein [Candidatus Nanopelagicus limnes]|uniref:Major facilitator superfamily protein n=1 Tax=Candidatus Nanopelagicus limnae TaxID=1884634 RepID=A0A249JZ29_9ACTN|nr:major facilitator superfamily protein [Candidatus Nanopelagicus limnes]
MLSAVSFFVAVGFGLIIPAIPIFAASFGVNKTAIGLIISSFAIMRFSSGLISGKLVDRFGERAVLGFGLFMVSFFTLLTALSQSYGQLLTFRSLGGLGSSMFSVSAGSLLMRSVNDDVRARAQSLYNGGFLLGGITGPAFGGVLSAISLRAPFFVYSTTLAIAGMIALVFLSEKRLGKKVDAPTAQIGQTTLGEAFKLRPYQVALMLAFINNWILFGLRSSILPLFVTEKLNSTAAIAGLGLTIGALVQGVFMLRAGKYSDTKGRKAAFLFGSAFVLFGILMLAFTTNTALYFISMALFGLGGAYVGTAPGSVVGDIIKGRGGQVIAAWQMAGDAGMIFGPVIVGLLTDIFSYQVAFLVSAGIWMIAMLLATILPETRLSHLENDLIPDKNKQEL